MDQTLKKLLLPILVALIIGGILANADDTYSIEYYGSFAGYQLPLRLINKMTKQEAESRNAAYYIGYFDTDRRLMRVIKMLGGKRDFDQVYFYYPNGALKRVEGTNADGFSSVQEYDENGKLLKPTGK
jgi:hypothetical protein